MVNIGYNYITEYLLPNATAFSLAGYHDEFSLSKKKEIDTKPILGDATTTDTFGLKISIPKKEDNTYETKAYAVDLTPTKDFYITSDTFAQKYGIGIIDKANNLYTFTNSAIIKGYSLEIPENDSVQHSLQFQIEKFDKFLDTTDYVDGTILTAHASLPTANALTIKDLSNVSFAGITLKPSKLSLKIDYDLKEYYDVEAGYYRYFISGRKITVEVDLSDISTDFISAILNETKGDFIFTLNGQTITVSDVMFPEYKLDVKPDDLITNTFTSIEAGSITFGF